jgi:quercetin 2,3-dioxygenase
MHAAHRRPTTDIDVTPCDHVALAPRCCGAGCCQADYVELGPLAMVTFESAESAYLPECHLHAGVEIVTVMLAGAFVHAGPRGSCVVGPDDVSVLATGSGVMHEEHVHGGARAVSLWLRASAVGAPSFAYRTLARTTRLDRLVPVASSRAPSALALHADATVSTGVFAVGAHTLVRPQRGCMYLLSTIGRIAVDGVAAEPGDRVVVRGHRPVQIDALQSTEIVAIDLAA